MFGVKGLVILPPFLIDGKEKTRILSDEELVSDGKKFFIEVSSTVDHSYSLPFSCTPDPSVRLLYRTKTNNQMKNNFMLYVFLLE